MKKCKFLSLLIFFLTFIFGVSAQVRTETTLRENWKFSRTDSDLQKDVNFDDSKWQNVTVPHDWAIYGPFDKSNDIHYMAIVQDGQTTATEHYGRTGGLPFTGVGWYRLNFDVPNYEAGKVVKIQFDGAMSNSRVYLNGEEVGFWPNGYNTFYYDITPYLTADGKNNTMAVRLENFDEQSRWYPGAGLYRNVHLVITNDTHIPIWGTYVTTPVINEEFARVNIKTKVVGAVDAHLRLVTEIKEGNVIVATGESEMSKYDLGEFSQDLIVDNPKLWGIKTPHLYTVASKLYRDNKLVDEYETVFGIRNIEVVADKGFFLNGELIKFKGVCLHHDLGPLGGAVNEAAIRRQIRIMQDMGANAIRTSHNMPAPEYVRIADEMGMMIMVETFDEWAIPKVKNGYNRYFNDWAEKDMVNVLRHFRNNPSVVMWCIGNEVGEQSSRQGSQVARMLQDICHKEDPTRPVTNGMDRPDHVLDLSAMAYMMEVPGFNYRSFRYKDAYERLPQRVILGTETASTLSSRGVYKFPVERKSMAMYEDHQASSYDVEHCSWSDLPEDNFILHDDLHFTLGEFVWTGFDYLGEPTPYYSAWPSHGSLFGIVDLAGIPKDRYYLYRSHWNTDKETLHVLPHWNWKGREGEVTPVFVYTSYPSAELFINGKSQGVQSKEMSIDVEGTYSGEAQRSFERQKRYRLMWMDTKYEPGTVKVVAYDEHGKVAAEQTVKTAGKPHRIVLEADRRTIEADGRDISFINVKIVDKDGNFCATEEREIHFNVKGAGVFKAAANGNPASLESFQATKMKLFSGQLTALVQSLEKGGTVTFEASAKGVKSGKITLIAK